MDISISINQIIYCILFSIYSLVRIYFVSKRNSKNNNYKRAKNKTTERIKVFIAGIGMIFVPLLSVFSSYLNCFKIRVPSFFIVLTTLLLILDIYYFYLIHKQLGDNWSLVLEIKVKQKLIKTGVYKYVRHPMYAQCWIWTLLQGIILTNYFVEIFGILCWGYLYFTRVGPEEQMMIEEFGEEYIEYMKHTGRLIPKISELLKR